VAKKFQILKTNNLFDFLSNKSSLNISSYSGNKAAPSIDMRGYGLENGFQNIVINVDGYRINNIDMAPSFLGTINTNDIDRIEILKGSGSVVHGDGSNAGSINIYTKNHNKTRISSAYGNYGQKNHSFNTGKTIDNFSISFSKPLIFSIIGLKAFIFLSFVEPNNLFKKLSFIVKCFFNNSKFCLCIL